MPFGIDHVYLTALVELLAIGVHIVVIGGVVLARRRDPSATLAWILFIVLAPVLGVLVYLLLGRTRMRRTVRKATRAEVRLREILLRHDTHTRLLGSRDEVLDARTQAQIRLGDALASTPATSGNRAWVLIDAAATYRDMTEAINAAKDHIHLEFYIIQPDAVGTTLRDQLTRKAMEGVEVRVLCDAVGSLGLPSEFWAPLCANGGKVAYFGPMARLGCWLRRRDRVDFRNHRKIVVVDGRVGFTGGINVGREYLGLDPSVGRWRDTHVGIQGPAVLSLQQAFAQDWLLTTDEALEDARYFRDCPAQGDSMVQIIDSGPDRMWATMELYHAQAMAFARERIFITNPYFIPSQTVESALILAALRGVDVRLLLPKKSDSRLVTLASRSYFTLLLRAGARIFEYDKGFVHAKTMVIDEWVATIGSANMDMRSFNLNFELNAFVFDPGLCRDVARHFALDLQAATEVSLESERRASLPLRLVRGTARLLSPML